MASISILAPFGKLPTSTHARAGKLVPKYSAYISFTRPKSFISVIKMVTFNTLSNELPAPSKMDLIFSITCLV